MEPNKVNDINPNWVMASTARYKDDLGVPVVAGRFAETLRSISEYYIAVYITGRDFLDTIKSIKDLQNLNNNYGVSGKIDLCPKNGSFDLSLLYGKYLDMLHLFKDRYNKEKMSKIKLIDKNPSYCVISAEYDVGDNSMRFKYNDYRIGPLISEKIKLDELIESMENKLKDGNSKLQD